MPSAPAYPPATEREHLHPTIALLVALPTAENLRRIERRQAARAIDEREFESRTFAEERIVQMKALQANSEERAAKSEQRTAKGVMLRRSP